MYTFSIIIPVYKVEKYLPECIESVLNQTFEDYEIILVDDGSPDTCPQMCDEYAKKDNRIKVIHQKNAGLACARNNGINVAKGEYIICVDSDDYFSSVDILQKIQDKISDNVDVVLYGYQKFFMSNESFGEKVVPIFDKVCTCAEMLDRVFSNDSYCGTAWTKAVRLDLLRENNIEFKPGMISEDIDWYIHLMCHAKTYDSINESAIIYRQRPGSISHSAKIDSLTDNLWVLEYWPTRIKELVNDTQTIEALMKVMAYYYANDLILFASYPSEQSLPYKTRMKAQSKLLKYAVTPRAKLVRRVYSLFGFNITIQALRIFSKIKTRM